MLFFQFKDRFEILAKAALGLQQPEQERGL